MGASPTVPNLDDYLSFLYGLVAIPRGVFPTFSGTATDGTAGTLVDANQGWQTNQWQNFTVLDRAQNARAFVTSSDATSLTFSAPLDVAVAAGDGYLLASPAFFESYDIAVAQVHPALAGTLLYTRAIYNLATDRLINYAVDIQNQSYFADQRKKFRLDEVSVGIVSATANETTSMSYMNPEQLKRLTVEDLELMKTPWGRRYIGIAQKYGETAYGLT